MPLLPTGMRLLLLGLSLHISLLSGSAWWEEMLSFVSVPIRNVFFFRDEEADLHSCPVIHGAGRIIHVTSSWGEPGFSSPSCCSGAGSSGRREGRVEPWGKGKGEMGGGW